MSVFDLVRIVIYRCHEKGLEVFLINSELENDPQVWKVTKAQFENLNKSKAGRLIELNDVEEDGRKIRTYAIEGDWHDIPSIRGLLKHDVKIVKETIKEIVPGIENGAYVAVKEAFKKVMPNEYKALKELKDVVLDKNIVTNI